MGSDGSRTRGVSDEGTVMGEYLAGALQARKHLRRTSLSQQQQLQALQAQERQLAATTAAAAPSEAGSNVTHTGFRPPSRTASRMSNMSGGTRTRSRAGSGSVHDSIPMVKDDLFSDAPLGGRMSSMSGRTVSAPTLTTSQSAPNVHAQQRSRSRVPSPLPPPIAGENALRPVQAQQRRSHEPPRAASRAGHYDSDTENVPQAAWAASTGQPIDGRDTPSPPSRPRSHEALKPNGAVSVPTSAHERAASRYNSSRGLRSEADLSSNGHSNSGSGNAQKHTSMSEEDKRSAHRRLYMRLREELDAADLVKFER